MKRRSKLFLILITAVLLSAPAYLLWYLRSDALREFLRAQLISRVEQSTGMICTLDRLDLDLLRGKFRLNRITLRPRGNSPGPLTLSVDEVNGRVSVASAWHLRLTLADLAIVHPQIKLESGEGGSWNPGEFLKSLKLSLDLAAERILLSEGWLEFNSIRIPLNLSLEDLTCEVRYAANPQRYDIRLSYKNSHLFYEGRDIRYDLDARLRLSIAGVDIESFRLRRGNSLFAGDGLVRDWNSPVLLVHATGNLDGEDLVLCTSDLRDARGSINVNTNLRVDSSGLSLGGKFDLQAGSFRRAAMSSLQGRFEIRKDVLTLRNVSGRLGRGTIRAEGEIQLRELNTPPHHVNISTREVPLREISWILNLPEIEFDNTVDCSAEAVWKHPDQDLELKTQAYLHSLPEPSRESGRSTLLEGTVALSYVRGVWYFGSASLSSPYTTVAISGSGTTTFHIQARTSRLAEPLAALRSLVPSLERLISRQPDLMGVSGTFSIDGDMLLEPEQTAYRGQVSVKGGQWNTYHVDSLTGTADWVGSRLQLHRMSLHRGAETVEGELALDIPSNEEESLGLNFRGKAGRVSLPSLRDLGVDISPDIAGTLSGAGTISNSEGVWSGEGQFLIEKGSYKNEPFDSASGRFSARKELLQIEDCQLVRGAAKVTARGRIRLDANELDLSLRLAGLSLTEIPEVSDSNVGIEGLISADGQLRGTVDNPSFKGSFVLGGLRQGARELGTGKGTIELTDRVVQANVDVQSDLGRLEARARISTESGLPGSATLVFSDLNVQKILSGDIPAYLSELSTALHGKVEVQGKFAELAQLSAAGEVDGGRIKIRDYELRNSGGMRFSVANRNLRVEKVNVVGDGSSLYLNGTLPLDDGPRLDLSLSGNLNLVILQHLEKRLRVSGSAEMNVRAMGTLRDPQVIGKATLQNGRLEYGDVPVHLSAMQGNMIFSRNLVRFENISGSAGSGSLRVDGLIEHQNGELRGVNLQVSAQKVRLPYPKDFRSLVDADLVLRGSQESQVLSGEINVLRADYMKDINILEQLANRSSASPGPLTTDPFLLGLRLAVDIHSDRGIYIDTELARLRAGMLLTLKGTPAYPYLTGRVEASEGFIFFRGNRFDILHASADFLDRNRINPVLEVRAEADVKTYRLVMDVNGDLDHMNINVTSDPPLSTVDIVSLLTTGKSLEPGTENARRQSEIAGLSAASILSESLTGVIGKRVQRIFGLQTFRVDPFLAGAENDPTARVTISERFSKDITVTFSRNLSTNEEQIVVLEYDVTRNLTLVASRDEQGKFGLDFRFRKRFR